MKGVVPSSGPKALVRTKQDTQSFSLFSFSFFFLFGRWGCASCGQVHLCSNKASREEKVLCGFVSVFCPQPTLLIVHTDLKESDMETFSGDIWIFFPAFETEEKGNTKRKAADRMPNATNLFWSKENLGEFPHILGWMVVMLELFSQFFLLIYFWHLIGGTKSILHSSISVLKSCLSYLLSSRLECQPVFYSEAALPI